VLNGVDLATDYQIVLHLLFPEVKVRSVKLPKASNEPKVDAMFPGWRVLSSAWSGYDIE
jgi:hypothetical protein